MRVHLIAGMAWSVLLFTGVCVLPLSAAEPGLENRDCIKCHDREVAAVDARGLRHNTAVTCLDCHREHPPRGANAIPECALCHAGDVKPHYALAECVVCHDPHAPLDIDLTTAGSVNTVCGSCHGGEGTQLTEYPSLHTELDCTECHTRHGSWLGCLDCHEGHSEGMTFETCLRCHQPHMPAVVKYDDQVPNTWCSGCHGGVVETLAANTSKHHDLSCVYCHKYQHRLVPTCETCHGEPHGARMHRKYPDCRECHFGPHALDK